jgi:hypothetical protein
VCHDELLAGINAGWNRDALSFFNRPGLFSCCLERPENHIKVPSGQYVEKPTTTRTVADMTHEMGQELIDLPRFTAYAKLIRETGRGQSVFKGLIQTLPLPESAPGRRLSPHSLLTAINLHTANKAYIRLRGQIENELRQRKTAWRDDPPEPPTHLEDPPPTSV